MLCNFAPATLSQFAIQVDTAVLPALEGGKSIRCCKVILYQKDTSPIWECAYVRLSAVLVS